MCALQLEKCDERFESDASDARQIGTYSNCVRLPATQPSGINDDVRASSTLIDTQRANAQGSASLRWQYFGRYECMAVLTCTRALG